MTKYRIDFYELVAEPDAQYPDAFALLGSLEDRTEVLSVKEGGYTREFWQVTRTGQGARRAVRGTFRKFRMSDLPEIGGVGTASRELELEEDQGLVEKNFFTLYRQQSLLAWHANGHGNTPNQFQRALSNLTGTKISVHPIIEKDALKRLMSGKVEVRSLEISLPRPKNPEYYPETDFNQQLMGMLAASEGDRLHIKITTDAKINDEPKLHTKMKRALKELVVDRAATVARVDAIEDGIEHPIDLIADRITSHQEIEHERRYPSPDAMYEAFDAARREEREAINAVLGSPDGPTIR